MRNLTRAFLASLAVCFALTPSASGELTYSYASDQSVYSVPVNTAFTVVVSLRETATPPSQSLFAPTAQGGHGGLFSSGVKVQVDTGTAPPSPTILTAASSNAAFNDAAVFNSSKSVTSGIAKFTNAIVSGAVPSTDLGGGVREIVLGTFNLTTGSVVGQTTTFTITDFDDYGSAGDTVTGLGTTIDTTGGSSPLSVTFSVTATAVPEPTLVGGLVFLAGSLVLRRRR